MITEATFLTFLSFRALALAHQKLSNLFVYFNPIIVTKVICLSKHGSAQYFLTTSL